MQSSSSSMKRRASSTPSPPPSRASTSKGQGKRARSPSVEIVEPSQTGPGLGKGKGKERDPSEGDRQLLHGVDLEHDGLAPEQGEGDEPPRKRRAVALLEEDGAAEVVISGVPVPVVDPSGPSTAEAIPTPQPADSSSKPWDGAVQQRLAGKKKPLPGESKQEFLKRRRKELRDMAKEKREVMRLVVGAEELVGEEMDEVDGAEPSAIGAGETPGDDSPAASAAASSSTPAPSASERDRELPHVVELDGPTQREGSEPPRKRRAIAPSETAGGEGEGEGEGVISGVPVAVAVADESGPSTAETTPTLTTSSGKPWEGAVHQRLAGKKKPLPGETRKEFNKRRRKELLEMGKEKREVIRQLVGAEELVGEEEEMGEVVQAAKTEQTQPSGEQAGEPSTALSDAPVSAAPTASTSTSTPAPPENATSVNDQARAIGRKLHQLRTTDPHVPRLPEESDPEYMLRVREANAAQTIEISRLRLEVRALREQAKKSGMELEPVEGEVGTPPPEKQVPRAGRPTAGSASTRAGPSTTSTTAAAPPAQTSTSRLRELNRQLNRLQSGKTAHPRAKGESEADYALRCKEEHKTRREQLSRLYVEMGELRMREVERDLHRALGYGGTGREEEGADGGEEYKRNKRGLVKDYKRYIGILQRAPRSRKREGEEEEDWQLRARTERTEKLGKMKWLKRRVKELEGEIGVVQHEDGGAEGEEGEVIVIEDDEDDEQSADVSRENEEGAPPRKRKRKEKEKKLPQSKATGANRTPLLQRIGEKLGESGTSADGKGRDVEMGREVEASEVELDGKEENKDKGTDKGKGKMREWDVGKSWERDQQEREEEKERSDWRKKRQQKQGELPLFFVDDTPGHTLPDKPKSSPTSASARPGKVAPPPVNVSGLLLPGHISIATAEETEELLVQNDLVNSDRTPVAEKEDTEGIYVIDGLDTKPAPGSRYYDIAAHNEKIAGIIVCPRCKEEGHIGYNCPHLVCDSCGAIDQHTTRHCHSGTLCFNCSKRGHTARDCPEPQTMGQGRRGCEKCGMSTHRDLNCPTIWRVYTYYTREEKLEREVASRRSKVSILEGGTVECGVDPWCARCAEKGHWVDDCPSYSVREPTAFGWYNALSGPFGAQSAPEGAVNFSSTYADEATPLPEARDPKPGAAAKRKEKERQRQAAARERDREDDAFDRMGRGERPPPPPMRGKNRQTRRAEARWEEERERERRYTRFPQGEPSYSRPYGNGRDRDRDEPYSRRDDYERERYSARREYADAGRDRGEDDDYFRQSQRAGPRYHGGYSR